MFDDCHFQLWQILKVVAISLLSLCLYGRTEEEQGNLEMVAIFIMPLVNRFIRKYLPILTFRQSGCLLHHPHQNKNCPFHRSYPVLRIRLLPNSAIYCLEILLLAVSEKRAKGKRSETLIFIFQHGRTRRLWVPRLPILLEETFGWISF